ncbi:MAG TPA: dihydrodipicolinate synthase family protein [Vicinamibacteria bacterium]|nr:dihydrodipicolinate synthase family protein [Vicinamibacteria bacterium]
MASLLRAGAVIPAHPLALDPKRRLDERRQVALARYYCDGGAGGIAVGVHTTQFAIREAGLLRPVLDLAVTAARAHEETAGRRLVKVAGICGKTPQAIQEATLARDLGYDTGLLSLGALRTAPADEMLAHCRRVAEVLPLFGFYLQPAVGGCVLDYAFWRAFLEIGNVAAIKVAPFNRYATLDVARALADSGRAGEVALYTGNDDSIVADLLAELDFGGPVRVSFSGGLLGQWAVWTRKAVDLLEETRACRGGSGAGLARLMTVGHQLTDANAALFDAANGFAGCIAGIHEVLRRQGLLAGRFCLDPDEDLSPGQEGEIDRVLRSYPHLTDDAFVAANLDRWLR